MPSNEPPCQLSFPSHCWVPENIHTSAMDGHLVEGGVSKAKILKDSCETKAAFLERWGESYGYIICNILDKFNFSMLKEKAILPVDMKTILMTAPILDLVFYFKKFKRMAIVFWQVICKGEVVKWANAPDVF